MRILLNLLIREMPGFHGFFERFQLRPPMGLLLLAAVLREAGHDVEIADQRSERFSLEDWLRRASSGRYDLIGLTTYSNTRQHDAQHIAALRQRFAGAIAVGGPGVLAKAVAFWLDAGADVAVIGEAERTAVELAERLQGGESPAGLAGTAVRDGSGELVLGPPRPALSVAELEALPRPAWSRRWIDLWVDSTLINVRTPTAGVLTARGCPYRCAFCGSPGMWQGIRQRSVRSVIEEIDWLVERFGVRHLAFLDDVFGLSAGWTLEFCEALLRRPYSLEWMVCLHPLTYGKQRHAVYAAMAGAGLSLISFGAQSADPVVLRNINRNPREIAVLRESIPRCRELGIGTALTYIFGLPGDTPQTTDAAVRFALEVEPTLAEFHPLFYFEGSELGDRYPGCDANPFSFAEQKRWSRAARRRFYLNPRTAVRLTGHILRHNPAFLVRLARMGLFALPGYVFERRGPIEGESGDRRT